jgi:hypothetical protein
MRVIRDPADDLAVIVSISRRDNDPGRRRDGVKMSGKADEDGALKTGDYRLSHGRISPCRGHGKNVVVLGYAANDPARYL